MTATIEACDLTFTHRRARGAALSGVDMSVGDGERVVVLGASGSGKSTLCLALCGLLLRGGRGAWGGSVRLRGRDVTELATVDLAREVGIVLQDFEAQLFCTSVAQEVAFGPENLALPRPELIRRVDTYLKLLRLESLRDREPATLSGGQKQKLAVAAALALEPNALIMDEATSDLAPVTRDEVLQAARLVDSRPRTLVTVEQDSDLVAAGQRVVLMRQGRIAADGPAEETLTDVSFLTHCGIRPPRLVELFHRLGRPERPLDVVDALDVLRRPGHRRAAPARPDPPPPAAEMITASDLHHEYDRNARPALDGVHLTLRQGEFVALIGQNGSGKTTLAKALSGLLRPAAGRISVAGAPIASLSARALAQQVGYVFQNPDHQLFSPTVRQEVAFGPRNFGLRRAETDARVAEALRAVRLTHRIDDDPFLLTKGERQRLAVASVLAMRPRVLVLDEPTTGLDHEQQRDMLDTLVRLNRSGHTVVVVTHNMQLSAEFASRVLVMADGRIVLDGSPLDVFSQPDLLAAADVTPPPLIRLADRLGVAAHTVTGLADRLD